MRDFWYCVETVVVVDPDLYAGALRKKSAGQVIGYSAE